MKQQYLNNLIEESYSLFTRIKSGLRKAGGLTNKENPVCARVCFLIDPQINPSTLLRTGLGAKQY